MAQSAEVISHWHQSVEGLSTSTLEFYNTVENALREKQVPDMKLERIIVSEYGLLSAKREYLGVTYGRLRFDICGAPFGKDFFFSWWLVKRRPGFAAVWGCALIIGLAIVLLGSISALGLFNGVLFFLVVASVGVSVVGSRIADGGSDIEDTILSMPFIGPLYMRFARPVTYYGEDTRLMFQHTVHRTVVEVVEGILTLNKLSPISAEQRKVESRGTMG